MTTPDAPQAPLLRIEALTKSFGGFVALDSITVEIAKGERFGLIGPNGSGKTTLVNCISGALRPNKGGVRVTTSRCCRRTSARTAASPAASRSRARSAA
jgi:ABC-type branched-subunit amino acid transport system ATPase component